MGLRQPHMEGSPHQEYTLEEYAGEEYALPVSTPGYGSGELVVICYLPEGRYITPPSVGARPERTRRGLFL
jgi:hypothetical protein